MEIKSGDVVEWTPQAHDKLRGEVMFLTQGGESPRHAALRTFGCHLAELEINSWRGSEVPSRPRLHALAIVRVERISKKTGKATVARYCIPRVFDLRKVST